MGAAGQLLDPADQVISVPRLVGDQLQQHQPQFAAVEHPAPAAAIAPVVAKASAASMTGAEAMAEPASAAAHGAAHFLVFPMARAAAASVGFISQDRKSTRLSSSH